MTHREKEILCFIEEDPLISQQDLAKKAGITRSSVGVHISNLMKKGLIAGKGYVLNKEPYAVIIGAVNIDIFGLPNETLVAKDSNPGKVRLSIGGVGRNIAHNMTLLGTKVKMITAFGDDLYGEKITKSCRELDIDISDCLTVRGGATSTYMFISDEHGDMQLAIADMDIYDHVTPAFIAGKLDVINKAALCICDTNIPAETIAFLAENCTCPLFADTVSTHKAKKLKGLLGKLHTLKPNLMEAELLTDMTVKNDEDLHNCAQKLLDYGIKQVFISLGSQGVYCAKEDLYEKLPCYPAQVVNATGAGDSFMAALASGHMMGLDLHQSAQAGLAAASLCIQSADTINPQLTYQKVNEIMNREDICI